MINQVIVVVWTCWQFRQRFALPIGEIVETLKRVPNYKIENLIRQRIPFSNYNDTISATYLPDGNYSVVHWNTVIWTFSVADQKTVYEQFGYISQTTSALQGRIIRSLPRHEIDRLLATANPRDFRRIRSMARL